MLDFATQVDLEIAKLTLSEPLMSGKLVRVVGLTLEAKGIIAPLGAHCRVENIDMGSFVDAEVVGFNDDTLYLMPFSEPNGIGPGARVWVVSLNTPKPPSAKPCWGVLLTDSANPSTVPVPSPTASSSA